MFAWREKIPRLTPSFTPDPDIHHNQETEINQNMLHALNFIYSNKINPVQNVA